MAEDGDRSAGSHVPVVAKGDEIMHPGVVEMLMRILGSQDFERTYDRMYKDEKGYVTVGIGFKINSAAEAKRLFFKSRKTKVLADYRAIEAEWQRASQIRLRPKEKARLLSDAELEIDSIAIEVEFWNRAFSFEDTLRRESFRNKLGAIEQWPADAQLGLLAMVWGLGPQKLYWQYTNFCAYCKAGRFDQAANETKSKVRPQYSRLYKTCFLNAWHTVQAGLPLETLHNPLERTPIEVPRMPSRSGVGPHPAPMR